MCSNLSSEFQSFKWFKTKQKEQSSKCQRKSSWTDEYNTGHWVWRWIVLQSSAGHSSKSIILACHNNESGIYNDSWHWKKRDKYTGWPGYRLLATVLKMCERIHPPLKISLQIQNWIFIKISFQDHIYVRKIIKIHILQSSLKA